jgi:DNA-binding SARP family transcriptional activator
VLWPLGSDVRAAGNLRSALWRLRGAGLELLCADKYTLVLRDEVVDGSASCDDLGVVPWGIDQFELLPGWYDDWTLIERERVTQRLLHGLEVQSRLLLTRGRCAEAVEAAMVAVGADPLRESAQQALIQAHFAEGNLAEGRRRYEVYRGLLRRELGIEPSPQLGALVHDPVHGAGRPVGAGRQKC